MPYPERPYLVEGLFAIRSVSLITGGSGSGKTRLTLQNTHEMMQGKNVFGFRCLQAIRPIYFCYDRPIETVHHTLNKLGLDFNSRMRLLSRALDDKPEVPSIDDVGDANLIILDGIDTIFPPGKLIDFGTGVSILRRCQRLAYNTGAAIVGMVGHSKQRGDGSGYILTRERSIGTTAFGRVSETVIALDFDPSDPSNNLRTVSISVRDDPSQIVPYHFNHQGWLIPVPKEDMNVSQKAWDLLASWTIEEAVTTQQLKLITSKFKPPLSKEDLHRCINELLSHSLIARLGKGEYQLKKSIPN